MGEKLSTFGNYPKEYNPRVHGPYDPGRFYGKTDTPFGEVKLGELPKWIGRRDTSVKGFLGLFSRALHRWAHGGIQAKRPSITPVVQFGILMCVYAYLVKYGNYQLQRKAKYH